MKNPISKVLAGLTLAAMAASAHSAVYNVNLAITKTLTPTINGTGTLDTSSGLFNLSWNAARGSVHILDTVTKSATVNTNNQSAFVSTTSCSGVCLLFSPSGPTAFGDSFSGSANGTGDIYTVTVDGGWFSSDTVYKMTVGDLVTSEVPVPAAAWLFGSALLGLAGVSRNKKA